MSPGQGPDGVTGSRGVNSRRSTRSAVNQQTTSFISALFPGQLQSKRQPTQKILMISVWPSASTHTSLPRQQQTRLPQARRRSQMVPLQENQSACEWKKHLAIPRCTQVEKHQPPHEVCRPPELQNTHTHTHSQLKMEVREPWLPGCHFLHSAE